METLRALLKKHEKASGIAAGAAVLLVGVVVVAQLMGGARGQELGSNYYLTADDGATYFSGSADDVPPVKKGDRTAVAAHLGKQQSTGEIKVYYMHQFTPEAKAAIEKMKAGQPLDSKEMDAIAKGKQFKKRGDKEWKTILFAAEQDSWVRAIKDSDGKTPNGLN